MESLDAAWQAAEAEEVMVIGGAEVYAQTLPIAECIYLTLVDIDCEGDTFFPAYDEAQWKETSSEWREADSGNAYRYSYKILRRKLH